MTVENLRSARTRPPAIFMQFTRQYKQFNLALFCFFEGDDDSKYYGIRIKSYARPEKDIYFKCNGKANVLDVHKIIESHGEYKSAKKAYFIDRDFDDSIYVTQTANSSAIYETPCYSIENLYTSITTFQEIIRNEFNIFPELETDFQKVVTLYALRQKNFHEEVALLNAWIACQRNLGRTLNLSNYEIKKFVDISLDKIESKYTLVTLSNLFPDSASISQEAIEKKLDEFHSEGYQKCFRGKFELDFFCSFLKKLIEEANQASSCYFSTKLKVRLKISRDNIISTLSQYAENPPCLISFLESFK